MLVIKGVSIRKPGRKIQTQDADPMECCYETTFVWKLLKVLNIKNVYMKKPDRAIQLKSPISLKLGPNVGFGE